MGALDLGSVTLREGIPVPMRDGTILRADVYRPSTARAALPVLVHRTPYGRALAQTIVLPHPTWFARQGYIVAVIDVRGRYEADGVFEPYAHEATDGFDCIEWAAALPGSSGRVGMYGASYAGAAQLQAAAAGPPSLACIVPAMTSDDFYDDWTYEGGALNLGFVLSWAYAHLGGPAAMRGGDRALAAELFGRAMDPASLFGVTRLGDLPLLDRAPLKDYLPDWLSHETRDSFWEALAFRKDLEAGLPPALHIAGWFDGFSAGGLRSHVSAERAARGNSDDQWLLAGPWAHIPWADHVAGRRYAAGSSAIVAETLDNFLGRYLFDRETSCPRRRVFDLGRNAWTSIDAWSSDTSLDLFLGSERGANSSGGDGSLTSQPADRSGRDVYVHQPLFPVQSLGGHACGDESSVPIGSVEQSAVQSRNDVLVYTSEPLEAPLTIMGRPQLELFASSSGASVDWAARLCVVNPDDSSYSVANGIYRCRQPTDGDPITVNLSPVTITVAPGQRIRIAIASSDFPHYSVNTGDGRSLLEADRLSASYTTQVVAYGTSNPSRLCLPLA